MHMEHLLHMCPSYVRSAGRYWTPLPRTGTFLPKRRSLDDATKRAPAPPGEMQITDRSKDVIKSGGEWISSIDLENTAMGHPSVAEAAVVGVRHPKWDERPLLLVVRKPGAQLTREEMLSFFEGKVAKWWIPDDVVFMDQLPHTATGKLLKTTAVQLSRNRI